jgi:hypothetical protein
LRLVITFSVAAGIRISHSVVITSSEGIASALRKPKRRPIAFLVLEQLVDIDAIRIVEAAVILGDADNLIAVLRQQARSIRANVAKALDDHAAAVDGHVEIAQALVAHHHHAAAGGFLASARTANANGLPVTTDVTVWRMCME